MKYVWMLVGAVVVGLVALYLVNWSNPSPLPPYPEIVFQTFPDSHKAIYGMDADGSNIRQLTANGEDNLEPRLSPDGKRIVFTRFVAGKTELYTMDANGLNQVRLTHNNVYDRQADWSPDGLQLAFVRDGAIAVMNADGRGQATEIARTGSYPDWSPDGKRIAYHLTGTSSITDPGIYVIEIGKSKTALLAERGFKPRWSPDGKRVLFYRGKDSKYPTGGIYAVDADGSNEQKISGYKAWDHDPCWSPDGSEIVFGRDANFVMRMALPGGIQKKILTHPSPLMGFAMKSITNLDWR